MASRQGRTEIGPSASAEPPGGWRVLRPGPVGWDWPGVISASVGREMKFIHMCVVWIAWYRHAVESGGVCGVAWCLWHGIVWCGIVGEGIV